MPTEAIHFPEDVDRIVLDSCTSTMDEARARATSVTRPTWILALEQTGGRGRRGRTWTAPEGHFAATLIFRPACTPQEAALRSFLAANALFETLALYIDRDALALKWPNDVLLHGGKVAGILLESAGAGAFVDWLSIGIGVNLIDPPKDDGNPFPPVGLFDEGGQRVTPETFLDALAGAYATQEAILAEFGFAKTRETWLRHAARLGEVITAKTEREEFTGVFETIDPHGNLILDADGEKHVIAAADVSL